MARVIDKTILSRTAPKFTGVVWAYPLEDSDAVELRIFNNGEWVPISGSDSSSSSESNIEGSGCNCSTEEPILLTGDTNLRILAARKVIEDEGYDISNVVDADLELWIANLPEEEAQRIIGILASRGEDIINSLSLTTENHGRVVQVGGNNYNKFLCEDGFILEIVNDDLVEFPPTYKILF